MCKVVGTSTLEFSSEHACATVFLFRYGPLPEAQSPSYRLSISDHLHRRSMFESLVGITTGRDRSPSDFLLYHSPRVYDVIKIAKFRGVIIKKGSLPRAHLCKISSLTFKISSTSVRGIARAMIWRNLA
ncbi:hypothetical protein CY34DRAFT_718571 [Suillus luteus UH-Slu-Lm8-n1]|uniref:Uncharacterized protein n=1 Tax=Suillus luteus UH-Slu-Lm8-n1 TaxID=930992 RepID=A0A0D0AZV1_9AGAM|nr:hypothetical protein CY34DRAFT_718571 [Suillus luteus UH-Slu-Lm8-n1]